MEEQIIRLDKIWIESHPEGFIGWEKQEKKTVELFKKEKDKKKALGRIKKLRKWAEQNNTMESQQERLKN